MASWGGVAVAMLKRDLSCCTFRWYLPGAIQPTRYPGARVLEKEEQYSTMPVFVVRLHRDGARRPERQVAVHVVLDEGDVVSREQRDQLPLPVVRHDAPERVVEVRDDEAGVDRVVPDRVPQHVDAHPLPGRGRDFENLEAHPLDGVEEGVVDRGRDGDGVAGPAGRLQRERHRLDAARSDDDLLGGEGAAVAQGSLGDLRAEPLCPARPGVGNALYREPARLGGEHPVQPVDRQQVGIGDSPAERNHGRVRQGPHDPHRPFLDRHAARHGLLARLRPSRCPPPVRAVGTGRSSRTGDAPPPSRCSRGARTPP